MQLRIDLNQKQTIQLNLTPELRQSINILQFSSVELVDFLHQQEIENPFLEVKENHNDNFFAQNNQKLSIGGYIQDKDYNPINNYSPQLGTLEEYLMEQIMTLKNITSLQQNILKYLIRNLNDQGFIDIEPAFAEHIFSVTSEEVKEAIDILQTLDPIGVGARNLKECLLIQLEYRSHNNQLTYQLIEKHLEDIATKSYHKLAKIYNVTVQDVQESVDYIKTLNPRPCNNFYNEITQYIVPDIIVKNINNEYVIVVNDSMMPNLSISEFYKNKFENEATEEVREYLKDKYQEAMILMNGISQRKLTLYKVTKAIIEKQKEFLQYGMSGLKPMILSDISEKLNFHESTISRAISNKYIQTQHGLFKLKNLFTTGLTRADSLVMESSVAIKEKIKALINEENKQKPLSDQMIAKHLEQSGILISRRTIAKYREEIGIPSSAKRKRY